MIPIRLDIDMEGRRLRDAFLWREDEFLTTPEIFAEHLARDEGLPLSFSKVIATSIRRQIFSHRRRKSQKKQSIVLDIVIGDVLYHDTIEWDTGCSRNNPILFARMTCKDLGLPSPFEPAIAFAIQEQILRPRQEIFKSTSTVKHTVTRLPLIQLERYQKRQRYQTKSETTATTNGEGNLERPKDPMIVKWIDAIEMKLPRQSHAFVEFRRSMRSQMNVEQSSGRGKTNQDLDDYIATVWNERTSCFVIMNLFLSLSSQHTHTHTHIKLSFHSLTRPHTIGTSPSIQQWFGKLAERRNTQKNKEWRRTSRDDGIRLWEGEEANRKSLREGGQLGDLLQERKLPGLRLSRKNLGVASNLLRESRLEERNVNFERSRRDE